MKKISHWEAQGLGTNLMHLSYFYHLPRKIELSSSNKGISDLLELFPIDQNILTVRSGKLGKDIFQDDLIKIFCPYFTPKFYRYKGQTILTQQEKNKPCVGLSLYHKHTEIDTNKITWPHIKFYDFDVYSKIIKLIYDQGYDIIFLDSYNLTLADKTFLIDKFCDVVFSYEGGIAHLTHSLNVPNVIFPWRDGPHGQGTYNTHFLHLDKKTYFITDMTTFDNFFKDFKNNIQNLNEGNGNNLFLQTFKNFKFLKKKNVLTWDKHPEYFKTAMVLQSKLTNTFCKNYNQFNLAGEIPVEILP